MSHSYVCVVTCSFPTQPTQGAYIHVQRCPYVAKHCVATEIGFMHYQKSMFWHLDTIPMDTAC